MRAQDVTKDTPVFDRFAEKTSLFVSRAPFFGFCVLLIVVWVPSFLFVNFDTWQLIINTATTIITFLMVALLQNSQWRGDAASAKKLDAIAEGLADLMTHYAKDRDDSQAICEDIKELRAAVGLEKRIDTKNDRGLSK